MLKDFRRFARSLIAGPMIATVFTGFEVVLQKMQTTKSGASSTGATPLSMTGGILSVLARAYVTSLPIAVRQSTLKNTAMGVEARGAATRAVESAQEKLNASSNVEEQTSINTMQPRLATMTIAATTLAGVDTWLTSSMSTKRVLMTQAAFLQKQGLSFVAPLPKTKKELGSWFGDVGYFSMQEMKARFRFRRAGFEMRYVVSLFGISGYFATPLFQSHIQSYFPHITATQANMMAVSTLAASVGVIANASDIVYKNQVIKMKPDYTVPVSVRRTAFDLFKRDGLHVFGRGAGITSARTAVAFFLIPKIEKIAGDMVESIARISIRK
jgi:hypothetical protein